MPDRDVRQWEEALNAVDQNLPLWLTCFDQKRAIYARDPAFRSAWRSFERASRTGHVPITTLWRLGSILFKPDSVLRRNVDVGLSFLETHGYRLAAARLVRFTPDIVRRLWRDSLGRLSDERIEILSTLMSITPSLYVLVLSSGETGPIPTTLRLTDLKGAANPADRRPGDLRRVLGEPQSTIINFVHTADEPADLVRELGVLFPLAKARERLIDEVGVLKDTPIVITPAIRRLSADLMAGSPTSEFDGPASIQWLTQDLGRRSEVSLARRAEIEARLRQVLAGDWAGWIHVRTLLKELKVPVPAAVAVAVGAAVAPLKRRHKCQPFPSCEPRHWLERQPLLDTPDASS